MRTKKNPYILEIRRYAVTVHRVQGATLEEDVHILLNSEFFADGQAVSKYSLELRPLIIPLPYP